MLLQVEWQHPVSKSEYYEVDVEVFVAPGKGRGTWEAKILNQGDDHKKDSFVEAWGTAGEVKHSTATDLHRAVQAGGKDSQSGAHAQPRIQKMALDPSMLNAKDEVRALLRLFMICFLWNRLAVHPCIMLKDTIIWLQLKSWKPREGLTTR